MPELCNQGEPLYTTARATDTIGEEQNKTEPETVQSKSGCINTHTRDGNYVVLPSLDPAADPKSYSLSP